MKFKLIFLSILITVLFAIGANQAQAASKTLAIAGSSATILDINTRNTEDQRVLTLKKYLESHNSPLSGHAEKFVEEADRYSLDWKLVASISGVESTFGKYLPYNSYNAWGWGIYGNNVYYFKSYDEAIQTISKSLRQDYMNKWEAKDIYGIGRIYAADTNWARKVTFFMGKIDQFALSNPSETLPLSL